MRSGRYRKLSLNVDGKNKGRKNDKKKGIVGIVGINYSIHKMFSCLLSAQNDVSKVRYFILHRANCTSGTRYYLSPELHYFYSAVQMGSEKSS